MATVNAAITSHFFGAQFRTQKPSFGRFQAKLGGFGGFNFGKKSSLLSPRFPWQDAGKVGPTHHKQYETRESRSLHASEQQAGPEIEDEEQQAGPESEGYGPPPEKSWPELLGALGTVAKETIESENPNLNVVVLLEGTPVTKDFRFDRVRVWVNTDGIVIEVPRTG